MLTSINRISKSNTPIGLMFIKTLKEINEMTCKKK